MLNIFYVLVLVVVSFSFGLITGEAWAPISGVTVHALSARAAQLEQRTSDISVQYDRLESSALEMRQALEQHFELHHQDAGR